MVSEIRANERVERDSGVEAVLRPLLSGVNNGKE
jgi:hypothetical protein